MGINLKDYVFILEGSKTTIDNLQLYFDEYLQIQRYVDMI